MVHRAPSFLLCLAALLGGSPAFATDAALTPDPGLAVEEALKPRKVTVVRVDKSERRMWLIAGNSLVKTYRIALGGNPVGHKGAEGDQRTPEGRYVIAGKIRPASPTGPCTFPTRTAPIGRER